MIYLAGLFKSILSRCTLLTGLGRRVFWNVKSVVVEIDTEEQKNAGHRHGPFSGSAAV